MPYTQDQLTTWISQLDDLRQHFCDELLWLKIEEAIRLSASDTFEEGDEKGGSVMDKLMVNRAIRLLSIYDRLLSGQLIDKKEAAYEFGVDTRTIQRDFDDIRAYLSEINDRKRELVYDRHRKGFVMVQEA